MFGATNTRFEIPINVKVFEVIVTSDVLYPHTIPPNRFQINGVDYDVDLVPVKSLSYKVVYGGSVIIDNTSKSYETKVPTFLGGGEIIGISLKVKYETSGDLIPTEFKEVEGDLQQLREDAINEQAIEGLVSSILSGERIERSFLVENNPNVIEALNRATEIKLTEDLVENKGESRSQGLNNLLIPLILILVAS